MTTNHSDFLEKQRRIQRFAERMMQKGKGSAEIAAELGRVCRGEPLEYLWAWDEPKLEAEPKFPWKGFGILAGFLVLFSYVFHSLGWSWWLAVLMSIAMLGYVTTVPRLDSKTLLWVAFGSFAIVAGLLLYMYLRS